MIPRDLRWVLGGIGTFVLMGIGLVVEFQKSTDIRQDESLTLIAAQQEKARDSQQATAEALARVAEIVDQMDLRGTQALDQHEREPHGFGKSR